jgi:hypothetical protein
MKSDNPRRSARQYIEQLAATGRYRFNSREAQRTLGVSADAAKLALNRLAKRTLIAARSARRCLDAAAAHLQ